MRFGFYSQILLSLCILPIAFIFFVLMHSSGQYILQTSIIIFYGWWSLNVWLVFSTFS